MADYRRVNNVYDLAKDALRRMAYGFYSITSHSGDQANAMVANWVMQVSFELCLIALGLQKTSRSYGLIEQGKVFAVNIFKKDDGEAVHQRHGQKPRQDEERAVHART